MTFTEEAAFVRARLEPVRAALETGPEEARVTLRWRAYLFSMLSARTSVRFHEAGYAALVRAFPCARNVTAADQDAIRAILARENVGCPAQKAGWIVRAAAALQAAPAEAWNGRTRAVREWVVANLPGVGYAKASFTLMLMGYLDVACLDVHMLRALHVGRTSLDARGPYLKAEDRLKRRARAAGVPVGLYQWVVWMGILGIPVRAGHTVYFDSLAPLGVRA